MAILKFESTTVWRAFFLNSIVSALIIFLAIYTKENLDKHTDENISKRQTTATSVIITIIVTFIASMLAYTFMYFVFGFGGSMLVRTED